MASLHNKIIFIIPAVMTSIIYEFEYGWDQMGDIMSASRTGQALSAIHEISAAELTSAAVRRAIDFYPAIIKIASKK
jgi:hypothetical protein